MKRSFILIVLIIFVAGCTNSKDPPNDNIVDPVILITVENFLRYSSECNWEQALDLLSGEALKNAGDNIKESHASFELLSNSLKVKTYNKNSTYARVLADVTFKSSDGIDRQFYEFELIKLGYQWKIFSQEIRNPDLNGQLSEEYIPESVEQVAVKYISLAAKGQWQDAVKYLSGQALRMASQYKNNIDTGLTANKIKITPIGHQNNIWLLMASYTLENNDVSVIVKVLDLDQPKITEITLVSVKGGN